MTEKFNRFVQYLLEAYERKDDRYSWLSPTGVFFPNGSDIHVRSGLKILNKYHANNPVVSNLMNSSSGDIYEILYGLGYHRISYIGDVLYAEHPTQRPNHKQVRQLKDLAIETGMQKVVWDNIDDYRVIWEPTDF